MRSSIAGSCTEIYLSSVRKPYLFTISIIMISVRNLHKQFDGNTVLDNIAFEVARGEVLGFLGPNGAGKTTTMRLLTGYLSPTSGEIEISGKPMTPQARSLRQHIGYLPENNPLYDSMRVYEYLEFSARSKQVYVVPEEIKRVVQTCQLQEKITASISDLSKGYKQRVGLAAALLGDPDVLILDEPTSGLDPNQAIEVRKVIREIGKTKTIIFSTHILQEVQESCDRALIIHQGKIVAQGTVAELINESKGQVELTVEIDAGKTSMDDVMAALKKIEGVEAATAVGKRIELAVSSGKDIRAEVFKQCVHHKWVLLELQQRHISLEDVFRQLTS